MKRLLFSHLNDIDGMGEVILSKIAFGDIDYILSKNPADLEKNFIKEYEANRLFDYDLIYITDLSFRKELAKKVFEDERLKDKVYIFDHHETAIDNGINNYKNVTIRIKNEIGISCATQIYYEFLVENSYINRTKKLDEFVELVRLEDTYEWKRKNVQKAHDLAILFNCLGVEKYINRITKKLKDDLNEEFEFDNEEEEEIQLKKKVTKSKVESFIENMKIIKVDDFDVGVCFIAYEFRNEVADYLIETKKYDIDAVAMYALEVDQISLRSIKENSSARIVAEIYGGVGHDRAAAIFITDEMRKNIVDAVFK